MKGKIKGKKGQVNDLLMTELISGVDKRRKFIRSEISRIVLTKYIQKAGWKESDIEALFKSIKVNFWSGIGYSKAISNSLKLSTEQKAVIWSLIHRYSKYYEQQSK